ncbi:MAG: DMT family transporter [Pseudomonadota bacterium]
MSVSPETARRLSGLALGAGGAALFSLKGIIMKLAFAEGATVEQILVIRMGIALPIYVIVGVLAFRANRREVKAKTVALTAGLGVLSYYVCSWLDFTGLQYISAQLERLILFTYPTITALLAWAFLGDRLTWRHAAALVLSYGGVAILFGREIQDLGPHAGLGAALVFTAATLFACYITASKPVIGQLGSRLFTSIAMSAAAIAILIHYSIVATIAPPPPVTPKILGYATFLALVATVAPSFMIAEAIARIGPGLASAVGGLGPMATAILAVVILGEPFGLAQAAALVLTVCGILLLTTVKGPTKANPARQPDDPPPTPIRPSERLREPAP